MRTSAGLSNKRCNAWRQWSSAPFCVLFSLVLVGKAPAADTPDEQELRELDAAWSAAAAAKDVDKAVSYYADDAVVFAPNAPAASTKEAIRNTWKGMITAPSTSGGWKTSKVEVSKSRDLAAINGTYEFTMDDASGKPAHDHGDYVAVFKKQADGSWKCIVDIWNSDRAAPSVSTNKLASTNQS